MRPTHSCSSNSWLRAQSFWRRLASDSGAASFASTMFVSTFKHSSAGGATRQAFAIIRWSQTLRGSGISSRLTWRLESPRRLAFQASLVKQLTIVKISFVWSVVKTLDVVVYGWKTLSSYRGEPLTMQRLPSPASPCPGSWPAASGSSTPNLITGYPPLSQARSLSIRLVCVATSSSCPPAHLQSPPATTSPVGAV